MNTNQIKQQLIVIGKVSEHTKGFRPGQCSEPYRPFWP